MKNADSMVKKILNEVDSNGDGKIQYQGNTSSALLPKHPERPSWTNLIQSSRALFNVRTESCPPSLER